MEGVVADMFLSSLDYFPDKESLRQSVAGESKEKPTKAVDIERVWEMAEPISRKVPGSAHGHDEEEDDEDGDKGQEEEEEDVLERAKRKGKKKHRGRIPLDPRTAEHRWTGRWVWE